MCCPSDSEQVNEILKYDGSAFRKGFVQLDEKFFVMQENIF